MATINVGSGGAYPTLQTCLASGVVASGDTIQLLSGYSVTETIGSGVTWVNNVTIVGDVADPSNAVITWDNPSSVNYTFTINLNNVTGWVFKGITLNYTGSSSLYSGAFFGGWSPGDVTFEDCKVNTAGRYAFAWYGASSNFKRLLIDGSTSTAANTYGIGPSAANVTVESCLFKNFGSYQMQLGATASVKNVTVYNDRPDALNQYGNAMFFASTATVANCVIWNNHTKANRRGITGNTGSSIDVYNSIVYGSAYADGGAFDVQSGVNKTNVTESAGVAGQSVLVDAPGGDFYPANPGIAYHTGDSTYTPSGGDLNAQSFDNPPSMGALEVLPPAPSVVAIDYGSFVIPPPNIVAVSKISVPSSSATPAQINDIYLGYPAMGSVVSLASNFTTAGSAGHRLWLASGTTGASDAQYVTIYDTKNDDSNYLRTAAAIESICAVFVDSANKRLVWDQDVPSSPSAGSPTAMTYYIPTSHGRLIPVYYANGAASLYAKLTCPNPALASTTNDIIGANTGSTTEIQTSGRVCLINMEV